ncbi:MAG: DUF6382 domain-containing protein [Lachnospiraceae bacterium]|nr:DUF6382 domain-containing protein [Lachnospiraceae bacterium]
MITRETDKKVTGSSLLLKSSANEDGYEIRMFLENRPEGFLDCRTQYINGEEYYVYDITGMESLSDHFEHKSMDIEDLRRLFSDLSLSFSSLEEYMLGQEHLRTEPENIFYNMTTGRYFMCFFPKEKRELSESLEELADFIIQKADHRNEDSIKYAYDFYKNIAAGNYQIPKIESEIPVSSKLQGAATDSGSTAFLEPADRENESFSDSKDYYRFPEEKSSEESIRAEKNGPKTSRPVSFSFIFCSLILVCFITLFLTALLYSPDKLTGILEHTWVLISITLTATLCTVIPVLKKH